MVQQIMGCFERTLAFIREQVADLSEEEMVLQPPGVPNHAAWTLGHLIYSCQEIGIELGLAPWLPSDWESQYGYGSLPSHIGSANSSKPTLLALLAGAGDRLRNALLLMDESAWAKPLPDEKTREILPTLGHALVQVIIAHTAFHAGQLAAWRRAIGRAPVGVFV